MVVSDVAAVSDLLKHLSERRLTAHLLHTFLRTVATHEKKEWKQLNVKQWNVVWILHDIVQVILKL